MKILGKGAKCLREEIVMYDLTLILFIDSDVRFWYGTKVFVEILRYSETEGRRWRS